MTPRPATRTCPATGKLWYPTRGAASKVMNRMAKHCAPESMRYLTPFKCRYGCGGWHLGRDHIAADEDQRKHARRGK